MAASSLGVRWYREWELIEPILMDEKSWRVIDKYYREEPSQNKIELTLPGTGSVLNPGFFDTISKIIIALRSSTCLKGIGWTQQKEQKPSYIINVIEDATRDVQKKLV